MIRYIETSKSDRAKCQMCEKTIGKETPRGVKTESGGMYVSNKYYCYKCSLLVIDETIQKQKSMKGKLIKKMNESKKAIILMELENGKNKN